MSQFLSILFLILLPVQAITQNWTILNAPSGSGRYDDIFFITASEGWACNDIGAILHTVDSGSTWVEQTSVDGYLRSIEFVNTDTGFCGGLNSGLNLFKTTNGGQTWHNITDEVPGLNNGICGLSCPGNGKVYGCGVWSGEAYLIKSNNSGQTWEKIDMSGYASALVDIFFISPDSGWVTGVAPLSAEGGIILSTSDGGLTWHTKIKTMFPEDYVWKIQTPDSIHFFASVERFLSSSGSVSTQILKSTDGGVNWQPQLVSNLYYRLQMVGFLDSLTGFAGDDILFKTSDGAESWAQVTNFNFFNLNRFWRIDNNTAFASGNGLFLYQHDSNPIKTQEPAQTLRNDVHRLFISPNPTDGHLRISVELNAKCNVLLKIVDLGRPSLPQILWSGENLPGTYEFDTNLSGYSKTISVWLKTDYGVIQRLVVLTP